MTEAATDTPDARAAHQLYSELRTRIAVQRLPYQHGVETRALESLYEIFALARKAMKDHPGCGRFARVTTRMLNVELRPVTAKWHRAREAGLLDSRDGADDFRADLRQIQDQLRAFALTLQEMAYGTREPDEDTPPAIGRTEIDHLCRPLAFGMAVKGGGNCRAAAMNRSEAEAIRRRRGSTVAPTEDAVGLALSGGGIRSATFCVGVLQLLQSRNLLSQFDYLSTVSGGGYTGCLLSSRVGKDGDFQQISNPLGPDTAAFRYVRQHAKYLGATDLKGRWTLVVGTLAGMLLNWTAPLFLVATAACLFGVIGASVLGVLRIAALALACATLVALIAYGLALRRNSPAPRAIALLASIAGLAAGTGLMLLVETGYPLWSPWLHGIPVATTASLAIAMPILVRFLAAFRSPRTREASARIVLLAAGAAIPLLALFAFYLLRQVAEWPRAPHSLDDLLGAPLAWRILAGVDLVLGAFAVFALNVNATSPHRIYRDALAKAFLHPEGIEQAMSDINGTHKAPYHLVNATVNLPSSTSPVVRDRRGDFFVFSKHWCGSMATGYRPTTDCKIDGRPVSLATAMAVSGAAASPHMGLGSKPTLTALMTLLNIRLGLWAPSGPRWFFKRPGFACLMREMTGIGMSEKSSWLNLSDADTSRTWASTSFSGAAASLS